MYVRSASGLPGLSLCYVPARFCAASGPHPLLLVAPLAKPLRADIPMFFEGWCGEDRGSTKQARYKRRGGGDHNDPNRVDGKEAVGAQRFRDADPMLDDRATVCAAAMRCCCSSCWGDVPLDDAAPRGG